MCPLSPPTLPGDQLRGSDWTADDHAPFPCPICSLAGYAPSFPASPPHPTPPHLTSIHPPPPQLRYSEAVAGRAAASSCLLLAAEVPRELDGALGPRPQELGHASQSRAAVCGWSVWGGAADLTPRASLAGPAFGRFAGGRRLCARARKPPCSLLSPFAGVLALRISNLVPAAAGLVAVSPGAHAHSAPFVPLRACLPGLLSPASVCPCRAIIHPRSPTDPTPLVPQTGRRTSGKLFRARLWRHPPTPPFRWREGVFILNGK